MTPLKLVDRFCPNYNKGECISVGILDDLTLVQKVKPKSCVIANQRCYYFEECILPLENVSGCKEVIDACKTYRLSQNIPPLPAYKPQKRNNHQTMDTKRTGHGLPCPVA